MKKIVTPLFICIILFSYCNNRSKNSDNTISPINRQEQILFDSLEQIKSDSILNSLKLANFDHLSKKRIVNDSNALAENFRKEKKKYHQTISLRKRIIGNNIFDMRYKFSYGDPKTISGTDNNYWVTYYPAVDITIISDKNTDKIINACAGKNIALKYDKTLEISKIIGKRLKHSDYIEIVSSIRYGSAQKLGMNNCVNKDCIEYYSKGNFTTVAFLEFNDKGDFVTLKKIAPGKVPRLLEY